jgi:hypothetical protein
VNLDQWSDAIGDLMESKGFHDGRTNTRDDMLVRLCLCHSEITEAVQEVKRHWQGEGEWALRVKAARELGDAMYRILDIFWCLGISPEEIMQDIHANNSGRPRNYGTPVEEGI